MIVPEYWAEAKVKDTINGSQLTLKRFGWSDISEEDAREHAQARANEAMERARAGEQVRKVDHKLAYNGAEGLPIREQIVTRHGETILTRNLYGALCLNTPKVFFADIDFKFETGSALSIRVFYSLIILAAILGFVFKSWLIFLGLAVTAIFASSLIGKPYATLKNRAAGGPESRAKNRILQFVEDHREANLRVYRTPMGFRVLAMHKTFDPGADETIRWLEALGADPLYIRMCQNQKCFRARVSPKPWRIGVERIRPSPGVWPIKESKMPEREKWIANYTKAAENFAACKLEGQYGSNIVDQQAESVRQLHDTYCKIDQNLPIA